nr:hypothetical protein [uncultured Cupriavidus sp.]
MKLFTDVTAAKYGTAVAEAIFPGDDFHSQQLRATIFELFDTMIDQNIDLTLVNIGDHLSQFVPIRIAQTTPDWAVHDAKQWGFERARIFDALSGYFIDGGHDERAKKQQALLDTIELAGVRIEGREVLNARLPWAGDWPALLLKYATTGRPHGVRFQREHASVTALKEILSSAGFTHEQLQVFLASSWTSEIKPPPQCTTK